MREKAFYPRRKSHTRNAAVSYVTPAGDRNNEGKVGDGHRFQQEQGTGAFCSTEQRRPPKDTLPKIFWAEGAASAKVLKQECTWDIKEQGGASQCGWSRREEEAVGALAGTRLGWRGLLCALGFPTILWLLGTVCQEEGSTAEQQEGNGDTSGKKLPCPESGL